MVFEASGVGVLQASVDRLGAAFGGTTGQSK